MAKTKKKTEVLRKVKLAHDVEIIGFDTIPKGTEFKVEKHNSRYVYVKYHNCELQLSRKDVEKVR